MNFKLRPTAQRITNYELGIESYIREFIKFLLVLVFSLIIGLEQRRHHIAENEDLLFGTDRTFAFFGLLGYVLFIADSLSYIPFLSPVELIAI